MKYWNSQKKILVILAHPDDPEYFCGATIAKWIGDGHKIDYCLFTKGEKGINSNFHVEENIISIRKKEQESAAKVLGVNSIQYLSYKDGLLTPSLEARKDVVRIIRLFKPNVVVTCDPTNYYLNENYLNHPDHRAAGQIVVDAVFPAAQNELFFPELLDEQFFPHHVEEVWLSLPKEANITLDVTETWPLKIKSLEKHSSQIGDIEEFRAHMKSKSTYKNNEGIQQYEEKFYRIVFSNN